MCFSVSLWWRQGLCNCGNSFGGRGTAAKSWHLVVAGTNDQVGRAVVSCRSCATTVAVVCTVDGARPGHETPGHQRSRCGACRCMRGHARPLATCQVVPRASLPLYVVNAAL